MTIISYAQNYEDVMLWRALSQVKNGFYIDVGAHYPNSDSVTKLFYESDWNGINIEPDPDALRELKICRPRDVNLGVALSDIKGEANFHLVEDTGLSTLDEKNSHLANERGFKATTIQVPVETLTGVWDQHVPEGQPVHFLKIDVEGFEEQVVRGADWQRHRPWIVVIEATLPNSPVENHHGWEPTIFEAGYLFVWFDGLNRYYVAAEHADLVKAFNAPPNVFDNFRRVEEIELESRAAALEVSINQIAVELATLKQLVVEAEWTQKPFWIKLLFRRSGKPKKLLRRALFHKSGKPRAIFRSLVLHPDGRPHSLFRQWMSSPEYQSLSGAVSAGSVLLSPDAERIAHQMAALRRSSSNKD